MSNLSKNKYQILSNQSKKTFVFKINNGSIIKIISLVSLYLVSQAEAYDLTN